MRVKWSVAVPVGLMFLCASWVDGAEPTAVGGSVGASAQTTMQSQPASGTADAQKIARGEVLFYQACPICHLDRIEKDVIHKQILAPALSGVLKNASPSREAAVLEQITKGSLRMPGFQYSLDANELDELMAFLRTH